MASVTAFPVDAAFPLTGPPKIRCHPLPCSLVFFACDGVAIMLTGSLVLLGKRASSGSLDIHRYVALWPVSWSVHRDLLLFSSLSRRHS